MRGMDIFLQQLINGLTLGSIYGLIAIGYTMVFGIIGMVNFAHGDVFMVGTFTALIMFLLLTTVLGITSIFLVLAIVLVVAMAFTGLVNWTIERVAYRPLRGSFRLAPMISAIGMSILLSNFVQVAQGPRNKALPPILTDMIVVWDSGDYQVTLAYKQILIMVVTAVLLAGFWWLVQKTPLGRAQRACEQDRKMAALLGVDVDRTISLTFVIGAALAAVAGVLYLSYYGVVNFFRRLRAGREGLHRRRSGRHRLAARRGARRALIGLIEPSGRPISPLNTRTWRPSPFSPSPLCSCRRACSAVRKWRRCDGCRHGVARAAGRLRCGGEGWRSSARSHRPPAHPAGGHARDGGWRGPLILTYRFGLVGIFAAIVGVMRLVLNLTLWRADRVQVKKAPSPGFAAFLRAGRSSGKTRFLRAARRLSPACRPRQRGPRTKPLLDRSRHLYPHLCDARLGLNIVVGLAGLLDLGYVAFYAVGAYTFALLSTSVPINDFLSGALGADFWKAWSFWVCLPVSGILAAMWGMILGFPVLRLRGDYLAIVTLAFGEIIRLVLINWVDLTNGGAGISSIPPITFFGIPFSMETTGSRPCSG